MAYATVSDVQARMTRSLSTAEESVCTTMLDDAALIIDAYNNSASSDAKKVVSCRVVIRQLGDGDSAGIPIGATQGSMSGLGYSQSWTMGTGSTGEIYLSKLDKKILGVGNAIGAGSPVELIVEEDDSDA